MYGRRQQEWLTEDVLQIQQYFPGATCIEPLIIPFALNHPSTPPLSDEDTVCTTDQRACTPCYITHAPGAFL